MLLLVLVGAGTSAGAAKVEGTFFNLPPLLVPITGVDPVTQVPESVQVEVRPARLDDPQLRGDPVPVKNYTFDGKTGKYAFEVDLPAAGQSLMVFMDFRRGGAAVTRQLEGIVLTDGVTSRLDVTIPREDQMRPSYTQPVIYYPCPRCRHRFGLFGR